MTRAADDDDGLIRYVPSRHVADGLDADVHPLAPQPFIAVLCGPSGVSRIRVVYDQCSHVSHRRRRHHDLELLGAHDLDDGVDDGRLAHAAPARNDQHLGPAGKPDRLALLGGQLQAGLALDPGGGLLQGTGNFPSRCALTSSGDDSPSRMGVE